LRNSWKCEATAEISEMTLTKTVEIVKNTKAIAVEAHINKAEISCSMSDLDADKTDTIIDVEVLRGLKYQTSEDNHRKLIALENSKI